MRCSRGAQDESPPPGRASKKCIDRGSFSVCRIVQSTSPILAVMGKTRQGIRIDAAVVGQPRPQGQQQFVCVGRCEILRESEILSGLLLTRPVLGIH